MILTMRARDSAKSFMQLEVSKPVLTLGLAQCEVLAFVDRYQLKAAGTCGAVFESAVLTATISGRVIARIDQNGLASLIGLDGEVEAIVGGAHAVSGATT